MMADNFKYFLVCIVVCVTNGSDDWCDNEGISYIIEVDQIENVIIVCHSVENQPGIGN